MRTNRLHLLSAVIWLIIAAVAFQTSIAAAVTVDVSIPGFSFSPSTVVVKTGDTVRWTNNHSVPHTSTSDTFVWDSGTLSPGQQYSRVFSTPGVFPYHCAIHPMMMGTVIVLEDLYTIPKLYDNASLVEGQQVRVFGEYLHPGDSKLVTSYSRYQQRRPMPPFSAAFLDGALPDPIYNYGGNLIVTGVISRSPNNHPEFPGDSIFIHISAISYEYLLPGSPPPPKVQGLYESIGVDKDGDACDPCKFAILVSGGGDSLGNDPGFWEDIENLYNHKVNNENYCPENIKVIYFEGNSGDATAIPDSLVDAATEANVKAAHEEIARRVAECTRNGDSATVQKMFSNHGADGDGVVLTGDEFLGPDELRAMQQMIIDSCCKFLYDEFTECYGGQMADSLKNLDDMQKTEIHANSAAGSSTISIGDENGSPYLREKINQLAGGSDYESAVNSAKKTYKKFLEDVRDQIQDEIDEIQGILDTLTDNDSLRAALEDQKAEKEQEKQDVEDALADGSVSWVRLQFKEYCDWKKIVVPPGGQAKITYTGTGGCGNSSVYEEQPDGSKKRVKVWNWNLPGSSGYQPGNETRVINGDNDSTRVFWIHNDNGEFTVTVDALNDQSLPETISNQQEFAGFSLGGRDNSPAEFSNVPGPSYFLPAIDALGLNLQAAPFLLGPCGIQQFGFDFTVFPNPWWNDMELVIDVADVSAPGPMMIQCPQAEIPLSSINIIGPGRYTAHLGAIFSTGLAQIIMDMGSSPVCFTVDAWGLRSLVSTWPEFICGDANGSGGDPAVDIDDIVYLINYVFGGGPAPVPLESGDANCSGGDPSVDIDDIVYLINYVFGGGPAPCADCL